MRLYSVDRVERISQHKKVVAELEKVLSQRKNRKIGAQKAYENQLAKLSIWIDSLEIEIPVFNVEKLLKKAIHHYSCHHRGRKRASIFDDPYFLERITYNYLRHCCSSYESQLEEMAGKVGITELYPKLKARVNNKISKTYPNLIEEVIEYQTIQNSKKEKLRVSKAEAKARKEKEFKALLQSQPRQTLKTWLKSRSRNFTFYPQKSKKREKYAKRAASILNKFKVLVAKTQVDLTLPQVPSNELRPSHFSSILKELERQ